MLKKISLILTCFLCLIIFIINSCKKTANDPVPEVPKTAVSSFENPLYPMKIRLAQRYYNKLVTERGNDVKLSTNQAGQTTESNHKYPVWKKAYEGSTKTSTFVEVPLVYNRRPSAIISVKEDDGKSTATDHGIQQKALNGSFDRLLIIKNKTTGKVDNYIVNYLPSTSYLSKHNYDVSNNQINKLDSDFVGYIKYKGWGDSTISLYKVSNNKFTNLKGIKQAESSQTRTTSAANQQSSNARCAVSTIMCSTNYIQTCYNTVSGDYHNETCGDWIPTDTYCWAECTQWEDDPTTDPPPPGTDGGTGSTGNPNNNDPDPPCTSDPAYQQALQDYYNAIKWTPDESRVDINSAYQIGSIVYGNAEVTLGKGGLFNTWSVQAVVDMRYIYSKYIYTNTLTPFEEFNILDYQVTDGQYVGSNTAVDTKYVPNKTYSFISDNFSPKARLICHWSGKFIHENKVKIKDCELPNPAGDALLNVTKPIYPKRV